MVVRVRAGCLTFQVGAGTGIAAVVAEPFVVPASGPVDAQGDDEERRTGIPHVE